jgi:UDP-N-acetylmuramate dehydrogenase
VTGDLVLAGAKLRAACGPRVRTDVPLAPLTSFRIGGAAALYLEPEDDGDLAAASDAVRTSGIPWLILGKGSNILVADEGFPGVVLRLGRSYRWAARDGDTINAGGAMALPALAGVALHHALSGLAFAVAIPASLGGSVKMNAGAHGGQMADVVRRVDIHRLLEGDRIAVSGHDAGFGYRRSSLQPDAVILGATLELHAGDPTEIRAAMDDARRWRRQTQPIAEPNCGSVFTNPEGDHAARLIDEAGCKGMAVGEAVVSTKHANFIVAGPGATAADVRALIDAVRIRVAARTGVTLVPEVRILEPGDG